MSLLNVLNIVLCELSIVEIDLLLCGEAEKLTISLCGDFGEPLGDTNVLVTKELYQEILNYVTESEIYIYFVTSIQMD